MDTWDNGLSQQLSQRDKQTSWVMVGTLGTTVPTFEHTTTFSWDNCPRLNYRSLFGPLTIEYKCEMHCATKKLKLNPVQVKI